LNPGGLILSQKKHSVAEFRVRSEFPSYLHPELLLFVCIFILAAVLLTLKGEVLSGPLARDGGTLGIFIRSKLGQVLIVRVENLEFNFVNLKSCLWPIFLITLHKTLSKMLHVLDLAEIIEVYDYASMLLNFISLRIKSFGNHSCFYPRFK
jgi:hypothetical protein